MKNHTLTELGNRPADYQLDTSLSDPASGEYYYTFDDVVVTMELSRVMRHGQRVISLNIEFGREIPGETGDGDHFRVFSTVAKIMASEIPKIMKDWDIREISFAASLDEPSRVKLYTRGAETVISRILGSDWNYKGPRPAGPLMVYSWTRAAVTEVAMNPSAFAGAMAQGQERGVLVGFEFEVNVPRATIKAAHKKKSGEYNNERLENALDMVMETSIFSAADRDLDTFDKLLKIKSSISSQYPSFRDAYTAYVKSKEPELKRLFYKIPEAQRARIVKNAQREIPNADPLVFSRMVANALPGRYRDLERDILRVSSRPTLGQLLKLMIPGATMGLRSALDYFDYDLEKLTRELDERGLFDDDDDEDDDDEDDETNGAAAVLSPAVESAMGKKVHIFSEDHERKKNLTDWYIEPDVSLEPNDGDGSAEIVSPPMSPSDAMDALNKFYSIAGKLNLYSNSSTGLHINVSIPGKLDVLKLAVFLGDEYVLKSFGRENNEYAVGVMKKLRTDISYDSVVGTKQLPGRKKNVFGQARTVSYLDLKTLISLSRGIFKEHTASISSNGKYISFRHAGGDYLSDLTKITNTIGRFVRAMIIASDPAAYRQEYLTKLSKLFPATDEIDLYDHNFARLADDIRKIGGVPLVELFTVSEDYSDEQRIARTFRLQNYGALISEKKGAIARQAIESAMPRISSDKDLAYEFGRYLEDGKTGNRIEYGHYLFVPQNLDQLAEAVNLYRQKSVDAFTVSAAVSMQTISIKDPRARAAVKSLIDAGRKARR
jgi:hypothetical protein